MPQPLAARRAPGIDSRRRVSDGSIGRQRCCRLEPLGSETYRGGQRFGGRLSQRFAAGRCSV